MAVALSLALGLVIMIGDAGGQPLEARFEFLPEGPSGFPQLAITFQAQQIPDRASAETTFEVTPNLVGDFGWKDSTMIFSPSTQLASDTDYQVRLRGGLKLTGGGRLDYKQTTWTFHTRPSRIAYLKKEGQAVNIWLEEGNGTPDHPLTFETARKVLDFSFSPGGDRLVYSLEETNLDAGLWLIRVPNVGGPFGPDYQKALTPTKLVLEPKVRATVARWSPGGDLIGFERRLIFKGGDFGAAQLWLIKADGTSLPPLYGGYQQYGYNLQWAAGGDKAFFWEPRLEAVGIFNFTGEPKWKPLKGMVFAGLAPSPDGQEVIVASYDYSGPFQKQMLLRLSLIKTKTEGDWEPAARQLPVAEGFSNLFPVWSPDGRRLAFLRQEVGRKAEVKSRIWIFDPQSGNAWPLLKSDEVFKNQSHNSFTWSPDGQKILFENSKIGALQKDEGTELWEVNSDGSQLHRLVSGGFSPKWVG